MRHFLAIATCFLLAALSIPTVSRAEPCLEISSHDAKVVLSGKLTTQLFAGPPNYESIANGDAEENAFILELPTRQCANDGGNFIDASQTFDRVHISSTEPALLRVLTASVGREVTVRGEAFGAHTGHHRAPLVILATEMTVR